MTFAMLAHVTQWRLACGDDASVHLSVLRAIMSSRISMPHQTLFVLIEHARMMEEIGQMPEFAVMIDELLCADDACCGALAPTRRFKCRYPGCSHHYATTDAVRKHIRRRHSAEWLKSCDGPADYAMSYDV